MSSLHEKAKAIMPGVEPKEGNIMAAILKTHRIATSATFKGEDFLWVNCRRNTSLAKLAQSFDQRRDGTAPWTLTIEGKPALLSTNVGDWDAHGDGVVVFVAVVGVQPSHSEVPKTPLPLAPKDANVLSPPRLPKSMPLLGNEKTVTQAPRQISLPSQGQDAPSAFYIPGQSPVNCPSPGHHRPASATLGHYGVPNTINMAENGNQVLEVANPQANPFADHIARAPDVSPVPGHRIPNGAPGYDQGAYFNFCHTYYTANRRAFAFENEAQFDNRMAAAWHVLPEQQRQIYRSKPTQPPSRPVAFPEPLSNSSAQPPSRLGKPRATDQSPLTSAELEEHNEKGFQLPNLVKDATPQVLESAVEASVGLLNELKAPLVERMAGSPDAEQWIQQIDSLKKQAVKTRTVIGVVGNTGAGKSSVINAMLEEERLVPTNCMRACTAVVTEISYNYEEKPYVAQIEFISRADWEKELHILFQDLLDGEGKVSKECTNEDTDAGIAYAKIKAVYPSKTKEDLAKSNVADLLQELSNILGSKRDVKETDSLVFYKKLQNYVDSKEKSTGKKGPDGKAAKKEREYWPLIRVVRLFVRSKTLSTGAVIVDLPGVHDSNAARAAVASGYMKSCTGLWIVAPINRAVDDKAAKSLLGESFKRQLKLDGGFNAVTFICSKTDDISLMEAQDSLGLDEQMQPSWEKIDSLEAQQREIKNRLEEMKETKALSEEVANDADEQIEVWETLQEAVSEGKVVYPPKVKSTSKKRKNDSQQKSSKKKRRNTYSEADDSDFIDDGHQDSDAEQGEPSDMDHSDQESTNGDPLTENQIDVKLQELKNMKKNCRLQKRELTEKMVDLRKELNTAKEDAQKIEAEMSVLCISGRNQYSRGAIQQDFAAGIKELDQEIAAEEDEESFNPDEQVRNYEEVAKSLPVFCVSSKGYQKLQGRLRKEPKVSGFTSVEETEIPQLQAHCEKLTETGRAAGCKIFLNKLSQLINSMTLWATSDGTGVEMTAEEKAREAKFLQKGLERLETALEKAVETTCRQLNDEFESSIFDKSEVAIQAASEAAIESAMHWGSRVNRENRAEGGLYWATYKAICRRNGCYTNPQGQHDWNAQLSEPMIKHLVQGWEKCFGRRLQSVMNSFTRDASRSLKNFHKGVEARVREIGGNTVGLSMLQQQIGVYEQILKDLAVSTKDAINTRQKDVNREFVPVIARQMNDAYNTCTAEYGPGSFARMKCAMNSHVAHARLTMFQNSVDHVRSLLTKVVKEAEESTADKTDEVFVQIARDYRSVLGGQDPKQQQQGEVLPRVQRLVRKEIRKLIEGVERRMKRAIGIEVEDEDEEEVESEADESEKESEKKIEDEASVLEEKGMKDEKADLTVKVEGSAIAASHINEQDAAVKWNATKAESCVDAAENANPGETDTIQPPDDDAEEQDGSEDEDEQGDDEDEEDGDEEEEESEGEDEAEGGSDDSTGTPDNASEMSEEI